MVCNAMQLVVVSAAIIPVLLHEEGRKIRNLDD